LQSRQCPVDFKQQCDEAQANGAKSAVVGGAGSEVFGPKHRALLAAGGEPGAAASNLTFMADGGAAVDDGAADAGNDLVCDGPAQAVWPECQNRPGYAPVVTSDTVEEVRLLWGRSCGHTWGRPLDHCRGRAAAWCGPQAELSPTAAPQCLWPPCTGSAAAAPQTAALPPPLQIHMFLFFIAVVHIAVGITAMVLSTLKLK
jgi:hypothetical protein